MCQVESHKVWGKQANRRTGITATRFGDRVALGVALGNQPHVLVVEPSGEAKLVRLSAPAGAALVKDIPAALGSRDLQRVTPAMIGDRLSGYADYRDKHKSERRRIACEPVEANAPLLAFDGKPTFSEQPAKPAAAPAKAAAAPAVDAAVAARAASPPPRAAADAAASDAGAATPEQRRVLTQAVRRALRSAARTARAQDAGAAAPVPAAPAAAPPPPAPAAPVSDKPISELRDCRSFVSSDGRSAWAMGAELHGEPQAGKMKWSMRLVVLPARGAAQHVLHTVALPDPPKELHTFESPAAEQLRDGSYALAARYRGSLLAWTLTSGKQKRGAMRTYGGGYPTLAHFIPDGMDYLMVTSQQTQGERYELRYGRIDVNRAALPDSLLKPAIEGAQSLAEPSLARAGKQRWLAYQAGERREGQLMLVPVDSALGAVGRPYAVTEGQRSVYESLVLGLKGDRILAVFLQNSDAGAELVSEVLHCTVRS